MVAVLSGQVGRIAFIEGDELDVFNLDDLTVSTKHPFHVIRNIFQGASDVRVINE